MKTKTELTQWDAYALSKLRNCKLAKQDKLFLQSIRDIMMSTTPQITPKQRGYLWTVAYKYRNQLTKKGHIDIVQEASSRRALSGQQVRLL